MAEETKKSSKKKKIIIAVIVVFIVILVVYFVWFRKTKPVCDATLMGKVKSLQTDRGKWADDYDYASAGGGTMAFVKPKVNKTGVTDDQIVEYTKAWHIGYDLRFDGWTPQVIGQYVADWINSGNAVLPAAVKLGEYKC
jgi:hypothetical protein